MYNPSPSDQKRKEKLNYVLEQDQVGFSKCAMCLNAEEVKTIDKTNDMTSHMRGGVHMRKRKEKNGRSCTCTR